LLFPRVDCYKVCSDYVCLFFRWTKDGSSCDKANAIYHFLLNHCFRQTITSMQSNFLIDR
jgi:hypothetical protein